MIGGRVPVPSYLLTYCTYSMYINVNSFILHQVAKDKAVVDKKAPEEMNDKIGAEKGAACTKKVTPKKNSPKKATGTFSKNILLPSSLSEYSDESDRDDCGDWKEEESADPGSENSCEDIEVSFKTLTTAATAARARRRLVYE